MNGVFHYYSTYFLALRAGFGEEDAHTLAYASNYVDHNLVPLVIHTQRSTYRTISTHHFGFWDRSQESTVWRPFHFFPSGVQEIHEIRSLRPSIGSPNGIHLTWPDSDPVKELLVDALKSRDLYRVGIALHTYADSWAHQGFSGMNEAVNALDPLSPVPAIGHAHAGRNPDIFGMVWFDPRRDDPVVWNTDRFLAAARKIYRYLATFNRRTFDDEELVLMELESVLGPRSSESREEVRARLCDPRKAPDVTDRGNTGVSRDPGVLGKIERGLKRFGRELSTGIRLGPVHTRNLRVGKTDENIELEFQISYRVPPYHRGDWKREAVIVPGDAYMVDADEGYADKFLWLKHEILTRSTLMNPQEFPAASGFEKSHFFRWMEAAKSHLDSANRILKQIG